MSISEQLTYCTTKIISYLEDGTQSIGTGFFMNFNVNYAENSCQPVVLTNKHVIEGATKIEISICKADDNNNPKDTEKFIITFDEFNVINHPDRNVDLCAISIAGAENVIRDSNIKLYKGSFNTSLIITEDECKDCSAMEDIIMIGYPDGLEDSYNNKPIIRKGITSTHVKNNYNNKKEFLIDMACFILKKIFYKIPFNDENSYSKKGEVYIGSRVRLLGLLYAGPQHTSIGDIKFEYIPTTPKAVIHTPNNLGLVIKASRILELEKIMKEIK